MGSIHEDLYRPFWHEREEPYLQCFYCGDPADTMDHQPPITRVQEYRELGLEHEFFVKVPCCRECNNLLSDHLTENLLQREMLVKEKLTKKYRRVLATGEWDEDEIDELGPNLRSKVTGAKFKREWIEDRLDYGRGVNSWLRATEFYDELY